MKYFNLKTSLYFAPFLLIMCVLSSCVGVRTLMMTAPNKPHKEQVPPIAAASIPDWESQKERLFDTLEREIYGVLPRSKTLKQTRSRTIANENLKAVVQELTLMATYTLNQNSPDKSERSIEFKAVIITPEKTKAPLPIIIMENFCPNHNVVPLAEVSKPEGNGFSCEGGGLMSKIFRYFFGRYITTPPIPMILERGYALAVIYPPEAFPDNVSEMAIYEAAPDSKHRWGAIGAWAWQASLLSNHLDQDGRFSHSIAYGHSRYGKSALLAAAYNQSIDAVISHQSGTGGASLSKNKVGETVASITSQYPHWFTPSYTEAALTIDQHHLLALIAPRPILLGNAKRDVWSDPEGAFRSALGASPIYELYGAQGFNQQRLDAFNPRASISYWMRPGTHGVVKEDWPAFLEFLDAHF